MKKIYTIGRDEGCDIVIPDTTDVISRLHATIRVESDNKIYITDQSRNGTYVNGMKMSSNVEIPITRKDVVSFAHIYNLDWSLVPKRSRGRYKVIIPMVVVLLLAAGIVWKVNGTKHGKGTTAAVQPADSITAVKTDTVVVKDTIVVEPAAPKRATGKRHKKNVEKDTVQVETPEKPIDNNPIY